MSFSQQAQSTASRAAHSRVLEVLTRAGFVGYGVVHLLFAWLAVQIAVGRSAGEGDQSGAMQALSRQPLGRFLVGAVAVGLLAMAIWQAFEAAIGHRADQGRERVLERLASAGRTLLYLYFAWTAYKVFKGAGSSSADSQQQASSQLMDSTGGRALVVLIGLAVAALGVGLVWYGAVRRFDKHLLTARMSRGMRQLSGRLGVAGYVAKGVAYGIAGLLLTIAAVRYDPEKARGLDGALRTLAEQSYGDLLLTVVALGIAAYGAFCFVQARYRKV